MNPMTNIKNVTKLSERELKSGHKSSWHDMYKGSAWIFVGGLPYDLTEGDIICVFSQFGEIVNINLVRDKVTGKQKGFCFICFEDQRSTILSVDNLNGIKILGRTIRVDHVADYKPPDDEKFDEETRRLHMEGCAPKLQIPQQHIKTESEIKQEKSFITKQYSELKEESVRRKHKIKKEKKSKKDKKEKKSKKSKKEKKSKKKKDKSRSSSSSSFSEYSR